MKRYIILLCIILFNISNMIVSTYMTYASIHTGLKCKCASHSIYYYIIVLYFFWSVVFVVYSLFYLTNMAKGKLFFVFLFCYTASTIVFIFGANKYMEYVKSQECNCLEKHYKDLLSLMSYLRLMMTVLTVMTFMIWLLYIYFNKFFKSK